MRNTLAIALLQILLTSMTFSFGQPENLAVEKKDTEENHLGRFIIKAYMESGNKLVIDIMQRIGKDAVLFRPRGPGFETMHFNGKTETKIAPVRAYGLPADIKYIPRREMEGLIIGDCVSMEFPNLKKSMVKELLEKGVKFNFEYVELKNIPDLKKAEKPESAFWGSFIEVETNFIPVHEVRK